MTGPLGSPSGLVAPWHVVCATLRFVTGREPWFAVRGRRSSAGVLTPILLTVLLKALFSRPHSRYWGPAEEIILRYFDLRDVRISQGCGLSGSLGCEGSHSVVRYLI